MPCKRSGRLAQSKSLEFLSCPARRKEGRHAKISRRQPSCKNLAVSASSRGVISIPSLNAETPLDAVAALPATARGAGTLRDAAAAVWATASGAGTLRTAAAAVQRARRNAARRRGGADERGAEERCARSGRSPPAPAGTA